MCSFVGLLQAAQDRAWFLAPSLPRRLVNVAEMSLGDGGKVRTCLPALSQGRYLGSRNFCFWSFCRELAALIKPLLTPNIRLYKTKAPKLNSQQNGGLLM